MLEEAVVVVADSFWRARPGIATLAMNSPTAATAASPPVDLRGVRCRARRAVPSNAATVVLADYKVPFLAHAGMEPISCTARVDRNHCDVWTGVQDPLKTGSTNQATALGTSRPAR